jgi:hypothetical protein
LCCIFRFSRLGVVSLPCEWSWHVRDWKAKYFSIGLRWKLNRSPETLKQGVAKSPGLGQFPSSKTFRQNNICMSPLVWSQYGAMTEAAESLIAQLYSHYKLTTQRRENKKIRHENKILKLTNTLRMWTSLRSIEWHQKYITKYRETIMITW